ncbi:DUF302 domain-containing protein [Erythrobacter mangrovi]|uniref:DUF302 domain-containing protein n=1 Tax=Erythrobacter mangrovi TaxID=2739433 RepID=A0A7D4B991_9SPHN|nr:DUF302 domain-containing protein [Erythrobacter mangrovi]QKG72583.1 DUF302 domain-containing protein [Erythrobacter mangrovi]
MTYYRSTTLNAPFESALERTRAALAAEGFGVINEIDMAGTLKEKIGVDFRPYRILGACNPQLAYEALQLEDKVGTMLPCNVVVQQLPGGEVEIAAIDPVASMSAIDNDALKQAAERVGEKLQRVIALIGS